MRARLIPHPATANGPVDSIEVELAGSGDELRLRYVVEGRIDRVAWPDQTTPERADGLWKHTCFEAFVGTKSGYREFNLSPSGRWASYAFDGPRVGMRNAGEAATVIGLDAADGRVGFEARIGRPVAADRMGLSAVIEDIDGAISYWALAHPSDKPDFHHPDSFILDLP
jgi:hypothetical protein